MMTIPRGFVHCDECRGCGEMVGTPGKSGLGGAVVTNHPCPSCGGSGLVPTEKLREDIEAAVDPFMIYPLEVPDAADAVLRKVAEHLREEKR